MPNCRAAPDRLVAEVPFCRFRTRLISFLRAIRLSTSMPSRRESRRFFSALSSLFVIVHAETPKMLKHSYIHPYHPPPICILLGSIGMVNWFSGVSKARELN